MKDRWCWRECRQDSTERDEEMDLPWYYLSPVGAVTQESSIELR